MNIIEIKTIRDLIDYLIPKYIDLGTLRNKNLNECKKFIKDEIFHENNLDPDIWSEDNYREHHYLYENLYKWQVIVGALCASIKTTIIELEKTSEKNKLVSINDIDNKVKLNKENIF